MPEITARLSTALADRYRIERHLGAGGMATVYLAEDLKHHRKVAVKVLRPELAAILGAERFLKEIEVTANLQHPNILPLYDSGEADTFLYYVMPYIEGETLRDKLNREKQLAVEETVEIAKSVAGALSFAHARGIIHRDIKPENILLQSGQALVADFGIALAVSQAGGTRLTETGLSLGTPHYMSPEQATGDRELDARSDVYSLGAMVYEMLVGDPPHIGSSAQAIIAKILSEKPSPIIQSRDLVPANVDAAVQKALAKSPADRFARVADFAAALENPVFTLPTLLPAETSSTRRPANWNVLSVGLAAALAVVTVIAAWGWLRDAGPGHGARFAVALPPGQDLVTNHDNHTIALSPDGDLLAYVGRGEVERQLYLRPMGQLEGTAVPGTERARDPFFSPDGQWIGYFAHSKLMKVRVDGGPPVEIAVARNGRGGTWTEDDRIVFAPNSTVGLHLVAASGGTPEPISHPNANNGEVSHRWPQVLPGGKGVLYTAWRGSADSSILSVLSLGGDAVKYLVRGAARGAYVPTGHLVHVDAAGTMMASPFDVRKLEITGAAVPVVEGVVVSRAAAAEFSISRSGPLAYLRGTNEQMLVLVDSQGNERLLEGRFRSPDTPRFSPDGTQIAFTVDERGESDVWVYDLRTNASHRFTFQGDNWYPEWSPDGQWIAFSSVREGSDRRDLYRKRADLSGPSELIIGAPWDQWEVEWTKQEGVFVYRETHPETARDIWMIDLNQDGEAQPLLRTPADEQAATVSPDGRWVAYTSDETGRNEVYVRTFPALTGQRQISVDGGTEPRWGPGGRNLFYRHGSQLVRVAITSSGESFAAGTPSSLFAGTYSERVNHPAYDVHPDGNQFVMVKGLPAPGSLVIVQDFFEELKAKVGN